MVINYVSLRGEYMGRGQKEGEYPPGGGDFSGGGVIFPAGQKKVNNYIINDHSLKKGK